MAKKQLLPSQRQSQRMARKVSGAFLRCKRQRGAPFFEHGHWWIEGKQTGAVYDVVDVGGGGGCDGFDFEWVSGGDDK